MVKQIYDFNADSEDTPSSAIIIQTFESNLDLVKFEGDYNINLTNGDEFEYYDATNTKIFAGYIRESENGDKSTYTGYDYGIITSQIPVRKNWENYTALEIMEDVITNFTSLTWVAPTDIIDSEIIPLYPSRNRKANQIIDAMHKLLGTTHYVDFDKNFMVEYEGQETNNNILRVGQNCITTKEGWISDSLSLVKNLTITGDTKTIEEIETITGDGVKTEFELTSPYTDIKIEYPAGSGTFLTPHVEDITDGDYEILREVKKIKFTSLVIPNLSTATVYYVYKIETNYEIIEVSQPEILAGAQPYHKLVSVPYLKEVSECKDYATKYKNKFRNPLREVFLLVNALDANKYRANQSVRIVDNTHLVNGQFIDDIFIIKELERSWGEGGYFLKLRCGDSKQFIYNREAEISIRIDEFNETHPVADIFNQGISINDGGNNLEVEYEVTTTLYSGTLPDDVLVSDVGTRYSVNESEHSFVDLWLKLDGNANDSSVNSNNGVWTGTEQYDTGKQYDLAADFDGSNYITPTSSIDLKTIGDFTMSCWVKGDPAVGTFDWFYSFGNSGTTTNFLGFSTDGGNNFRFASNNSSGINKNISSSSSATDGNYHLLIATYDSVNNTIEFFSDNVSQGTDTTIDMNDFNTFNTIAIGALERNSVGNNFFGLVTDVRFYPKKIDSAEMEAIYNSGTGITGNTLVDEFRSIDESEYNNLFTEVTE